jgi:hypothetical protein
MRDELIQRLAERGVRFEAGVAPVGWVDACHLVVREVQTGVEQIVEIDALVAAIGSPARARWGMRCAGVFPSCMF